MDVICRLGGPYNEKSVTEVCTATIREVNSLKLTHFLLKIVQRETHRITRHYSVKLQTAKQTLTTSKHSIEFTYIDFPCHLKVNGDLR